MARTLLLTGFQPFDGWAENPSSAVATALDGWECAGVRVVARVLPVSFAATPGALSAVLETTRPDALIALGLAAGEVGFRIEQVAINLVHSERPDNDGATRCQVPIDVDGPPARFATWDGLAVRDALIAAGLPARLSFHAGTHCCNLTLYQTLARVSGPVGFLHLPCLPSMAAAEPRQSSPSMALASQIEGVRLVVAAVAGQVP
jgi:pyroglutamyl-peptidase